jgi:hypothetical protein
MPLKGTAKNQNEIFQPRNLYSKTEFCKQQRKKSFLVKITAVNIQYIAARENLNQEPQESRVFTKTMARPCSLPQSGRTWQVFFLEIYFLNIFNYYPLVILHFDIFTLIVIYIQSQRIKNVLITKQISSL